MEEISLVDNEDITCTFCCKIFESISDLKNHMIISKKFPNHQKDKKDFRIEKLEYEIKEMKKQINYLLFHFNK